jgi:hypothetical protein
MPIHGRPHPKTSAKTAYLTLKKREDGIPDPQEEGGRRLFLVAALSARWDWYLTREPMGKVVWYEIQALLPGWARGRPW